MNDFFPSGSVNLVDYNANYKELARLHKASENPSSLKHLWKETYAGRRSEISTGKYNDGNLNFELYDFITQRCPL